MRDRICNQIHESITNALYKKMDSEDTGGKCTAVQLSVEEKARMIEFI